MKEFWLGTAEDMVNRSNMAPRSRPCDRGSPRAKPPRPESGLRLTIGAAARGSPLLRAETRSSHCCGSGLWISTKKQGVRSSVGPARGRAAASPPFLSPNWREIRLWGTSDIRKPAFFFQKYGNENVYIQVTARSICGVIYIHTLKQKTCSRMPPQI